MESSHIRYGITFSTYYPNWELARQCYHQLKATPVMVDGIEYRVPIKIQCFTPVNFLVVANVGYVISGNLKRHMG